MPWVDACAVEDVEEEDLLRWDHGDQTYVIVHAEGGGFFCTAGLCSHEAVHLADGLVMGFEIECPKHNGLFDCRSGEALRSPACISLQTFDVKQDAGRVFVMIPE